MAALVGGTIGTIAIVVGILIYVGALASSWDERKKDKKND